MKPTVIVVGSLNVDLMIRVPRLPRAGETVVGTSMSSSQGGKGANQAAAAARLGARVVMVGRVGNDDAGKEALSSLSHFEVDCSYVALGEAATGIAVILVDEAGENTIAVAPGANGELEADAVAAALLDVARAGDVVLTCLEVPVEAVRAAALVARRLACRFILNPAPVRPIDDELLGLCDVLTPNEHELTGMGAADAEGLLDRGAGAVIVTKGARGATLHRPGKPTLRQRAPTVTCVDSTGAGDAFNGTLAWALASGQALPDAVRLAAAGGALATTGWGARAALGTKTAVCELGGGLCATRGRSDR